MTEKLNHPFIKKDNHDYVDYYLVVDDIDKYQIFKEHSSLYDCEVMVLKSQILIHLIISQVLELLFLERKLVRS